MKETMTSSQCTLISLSLLNLIIVFKEKRKQIWKQILHVLTKQLQQGINGLRKLISDKYEQNDKFWPKRAFLSCYIQEK